MLELNRLYCMDCMEGMKQIPDKFFELAIVDPPYGIKINSSGRVGHYGGRGKKWDSETPPEEYFSEIGRVSQNQIVWGGNYFALPKTRCFLIWDKMQPQNVSFASCEYAWTSFDQSAKTFYMRPQGDPDRIHPTQKPIALYKWLLTNYAKPGDKILDTHVGSASSLIACHELGFDYMGFEIDADYHKAASERLDRAKRQVNIFSAIDAPEQIGIEVNT
ncbi:MAG: DNA methyltransferase [Kiritimatiellales bacterium]